MNKKYLSFALFGALMTVSTGVFTSCKDYDDDIDGLEQKYTDLNAELGSQKESLQKALNAAQADATAAQAAADAAKAAADAAQSSADKAAAEAAAAKALAEKAASDAKAEAIQEAKAYVDELMKKVATDEELSVLSGKIDGIQSDLNTMKNDLKALGVNLDEEIAAREKADEALQIQINALRKFEEATGQNFKELQDELDDMRKSLANLGSKEEIENLLKTANEKMQEEVSDQLNTLLGVLSSRLNSLVFIPSFYYQGIEAMGVNSYSYNALTLAKVDADGHYATDAPKAGATATLTPGIVTEYHMNPSIADWTKIKMLTYISADKEYKTRANGVVEAVVDDFKGEKGILKVKSHLVNGTVKDIAQDGKVTVLALQAHYTNGTQDTIITSDYAALKAVYAHNLKLALSEPFEAIETTHLHATAAAAINAPATFDIEWNNAGKDLSELINTHYDEITDPNDATKDVHKKLDKYAFDKTSEDYGFKYSYELVGYHVGENKTSESAHAALNGSLLRPQMPKDGKQQPYGAEQNKAEKGREPLVRVILTDVKSNKIATVGYLKLRIVDTTTEDEVILKPSFGFNNVFTVNCTENETELKLTWHQFEEQIIAQLENQGVSKQDFHDNFTLDGGVNNATQYDGVEVGSKALVTKYGVVSQTIEDAGGNETQILKWVVKNNQAYHFFKDEKNTTMTANVRYTKVVDAAKNIKQYVYVTLNWTPSQRNVTPAGTVANSDKNRSYWYAKNDPKAGTGYSDIHANVETVGQVGADDEFKTDILNTFMGNDVTVSGVASVYTAFQDAMLTKTFTFVDPQGTALTPVRGNSGERYDITVSTDGKTLLANKVGSPLVKYPVVTINGSVLEYNADDTTNEWAKDILNYADHNELGDKQTFTANIQINAANCDYVPFALSNNTFFAKFLRPVSIADPRETNFLDGETGGSKSLLKLNFTDWRDHNFDDTKVTKGENYYAYYGIKAITCLEGFIRTDMNSETGNFDHLLSEVSKNVKFEFTAPTTAEIQNGKGDYAHYFGELAYENNNTTVGDFTIQVPFDVEYDWGTIRVYVICKVSGTVAN